MVKALDEVAASAAGLAAPGKVLVAFDLRIKPVVNFSYFFYEQTVCSALAHHFFVFLIFSISSYV
ncbi:hypothetical protein ES703_32553 [subsurface metagenome]